MADPVLVAKAAAAVLTSDKGKKTLVWVAAAVLSPFILIILLLCSFGAGAAGHNASAVELCFHGGTIPANTPAEYRTYIQDMRTSLSLLDGAVRSVNLKTEAGNSLEPDRVKAIFYALYFGAPGPALWDHGKFADCFVTYETRTETITYRDDDRVTVTEERTRIVAVPITDLDQIYRNIAAAMGVTISSEQKKNAAGVYSQIHQVAAGEAFIGLDGFCSPVGAGWQSLVTSEFGYRTDPFTGYTTGHSGIDLAVPVGTSVRAALAGTVITAAYDADGYGWYAAVRHENGLVTLYSHCSQLLVQVGQEVQAGDVVALSGSTGRSTGAHLHFEVRLNGARVDPRNYLP